MKSRRKEDSGVIGKDVLGFSYIKLSVKSTF